MQPQSERLSALERERERQDLSFRDVRESLAGLAAEARLHIPARVLRELEAAFSAAQGAAAAPLPFPHLRA